MCRWGLGWKDRCLPEKLAGAVNAAIPHTAMAAFLTKFGRPVEVRSYGSGGAVHNCIHLLWSLTPTICFDGYSTGAGVAGWVEGRARAEAFTMLNIVDRVSEVFPHVVRAKRQRDYIAI